MPARPRVRAQKPGEQGLHVAVGGMNLSAEQCCPAQMRVLDRNGPEQGLVDRADGDLRCQVALRVLGGLAGQVRPGVVRAVVPLHLEVGQQPAFGVVSTQLPRYGEHHGGSVSLREHVIAEALHAPEDLSRRNARGRAK